MMTTAKHALRSLDGWAQEVRFWLLHRRMPLPTEPRGDGQHPARAHIHAPRTVGEYASDAITGFVGSWRFVGIHAVWFIAWIVSRIEAFPFGLLTLLVSLEAIFLSTFVMMSQNRAAARDRVRDDTEAEEVADLTSMNKTQLIILGQQNEILALLRDCAPEPTKPSGAPGQSDGSAS